MKNTRLLLLLIFGCFIVCACEEQVSGVSVPSESTDPTDTETEDSETASWTDSDSDTLSDTGSGTAEDTGSDSETTSDTDKDTGSATDTKTSTDPDTDSGTATETVDTETETVDTETETVDIETETMDTETETVDTETETVDTETETGDTETETVDTETETVDTETETGDTATETETTVSEPYVIAGVWHGEAWTDTGDVSGGTISSISGVYTLGTDSICVNGYLVASYDSLGLVAFNVQQDVGSDGFSPWYPGIKYRGVNVNIFQKSNLTIRIELAAEDNAAYCVEFSNGQATLDWGNFRTDCWTSGGTVYDKGIGILSVKVYAAGLNTSTASFDYCIRDLSPALAN
jgi:hypothetical protein